MRSNRWVMGGLCALLVMVCCLSSQGQVGTSSASLSMARAGLPAVPEAVLVEEFVNYHRHDIPLPMGQAVALDLRWGAGSCGPQQPQAVLQIGLATTQLVDKNKVPPLNIALVIDQSGSMQGKRIENVKKAILAFADKLRAMDRVTIVGFSTDAQVLLPSQTPLDNQQIRAAVQAIKADGNTNLHAGLMLGYRQVLDNYDPIKTNRVILLTDGQANTGVTDARQIINDSLAFNHKDVDLSTIGLGHAFNYDLLRALSRSGRGLMHFVADDKDIQKTFVDELESLLSPVARHVQLTIDVDEELQVETIYGYQPNVDGHCITLGLDDLNNGATQVVLIRFRANDLKDSKPLAVTVRLRYFDVASRTIAEREMRTTVDYDVSLSAASPLQNVSVKKNVTIAQLAQGIKHMAHAVLEEKLQESVAAIERPLKEARARYPDLEDVDVKRVYEITAKYHKDLVKHVKALRHEKELRAPKRAG